MLQLVRLTLRVILCFLAIGIVIGIATPDTGTAEKVALGAMFVGVILAGIPVGRIGMRTT